MLCKVTHSAGCISANTPGLTTALCRNWRLWSCPCIWCVVLLLRVWLTSHNINAWIFWCTMKHDFVWTPILMKGSPLMKMVGGEGCRCVRRVHACVSEPTTNNNKIIIYVKKECTAWQAMINATHIPSCFHYTQLILMSQNTCNNFTLMVMFGI